MKLKAFDFEQILYEHDYSVVRNKEIKEKLKPHVLYFKKDDSIGICLKENKKEIMKILKGYGKTDSEGHFIDVDKFLTEDYGWDDIILGNYQLNGEEVWSEFGTVLKQNEKVLLNAGDNFEKEWFRLQKTALRNMWNNEVESIKEEIEMAEEDLESLKGFYE